MTTYRNCDFCGKSVCLGAVCADCVSAAIQEDKDAIITRLTRERDGATGRAESLRKEVERLLSQITDAQGRFVDVDGKWADAESRATAAEALVREVEVDRDRWQQTAEDWAADHGAARARIAELERGLRFVVLLASGDACTATSAYSTCECEVGKRFRHAASLLTPTAPAPRTDGVVSPRGADWRPGEAARNEAAITPEMHALLTQHRRHDQPPQEPLTYATPGDLVGRGEVGR